MFKLDWALDGPVPWDAAEAGRAGTVHVGGTLDEIAASEEAVSRGGHAERPFVLVVQPSLFDADRAPSGKHTLWAYCHVPSGSTVDMTARIEAQVERFAPGFRDRILARSVMPPVEVERRNANYVGGDINGGVQACASSSPGRPREPSRMRRPPGASTSAPRRRPQVAASTACAATTRHKRP